MRPEYQELKEEVTRLGGTKEFVNSWPQKKAPIDRRSSKTNASLWPPLRALSRYPLFNKVRFDVLLIDEVPLIPAAYLLAAAALTREKIILSGNTMDIPTPQVWASPLKQSRIVPQSSPVSS